MNYCTYCVIILIVGGFFALLIFFLAVSPMNRCLELLRNVDTPKSFKLSKQDVRKFLQSNQSKFRKEILEVLIFIVEAFLFLVIDESFDSGVILFLFGLLDVCLMLWVFNIHSDDIFNDSKSREQIIGYFNKKKRNTILLLLFHLLFGVSGWMAIILSFSIFCTKNSPL